MQCGHEDGHQYRNNGDDHQELYQRKSSMTVWKFMVLYFHTNTLPLILYFHVSELIE
jgi:hypothetical protein